jgi:copper chaperone CopZ
MSPNQQKTFVVPNIGCEGCVRSVKNAIEEVSGAQFVTGNQFTKQITVSWAAPASWDQIKAALVEIEYPPQD